MMRLFLAFFIVNFFTPSGWCGVCRFPQSQLKIYTTHIESANPTGISEAQFNSAINLVYKVWAPVVKKNHANLVFNRLWSDPTVNSDTDVEGENWVINAYGGLARYPGMTADGYTLVACHELGHHLGGAPRFSDSDSSWASVEGEADYFATLQCAKKTIKDPNRIAAASQVLANVLAELDEDPVPRPKTPDTTKVSSTFEDHPAAQCRLDTYLAGAVCGIPYTPLSASDPKVGTCFLYKNDTAGKGSRPRCWFYP